MEGNVAGELKCRGDCGNGEGVVDNMGGEEKKSDKGGGVVMDLCLMEGGGGGGEGVRKENMLGEDGENG